MGAMRRGIGVAGPRRHARPAARVPARSSWCRSRRSSARTSAPTAACWWCAPRPAKGLPLEEGDVLQTIDGRTPDEPGPRVPHPELLPAGREGQARRAAPAQAAGAGGDRAGTRGAARRCATDAHGSAGPGAGHTAAAASTCAAGVGRSGLTPDGCAQGARRPAGPLLACAAHAAQRLPLRPSRRTDRAAPGRPAQRQPAAAPRRPQRVRSPICGSPTCRRCSRPGDLLVFNDTRVIPARLHGRKATGGTVELLLERVLGRQPGARAAALEQAARAGFDHPAARGHRSHGRGPRGRFLAARLRHRSDRGLRAPRRDAAAAVPATRRPASRPRALPDGLRARAGRGGRADRGAALHAGCSTALRTRRRGAGARHAARRRRAPSSRCGWTTCASTACTPSGSRCRAATASAVAALPRARRPRRRRRHDRRCARSSPRRRAGASSPCAGDTRLFITPGYRFRVVDALLTNFHLPRVHAADAGVRPSPGASHVLAAYRHAVAARYRFFSYGDAMFVEPDPAALAPREAA